MAHYPKRTHHAGQISAAEIGATLTLNGWVQGRRDLGGLVFIDLRDHTGLLQVVFSPQHAPGLMERAGELRSEYVVAVRGELRRRERENPNMPTGEVELYASELVIINRAETPPFEIGARENVNEETRLKYRYLDLRDPELQRIMRLRNEVYQSTHRYFAHNGFIEVETPIMVKSTPEGARDYLVPSRIYPGSFYALPQSPQIYKQILMIGGSDRYVQIAKCFRDEDLRADRQPEFTQIDFEMSFVEQEDVLDVAERYIVQLWRDTKGIDLPRPFPRLTYAEVMERYGSDKPDTRFGMELRDCGSLFSATAFTVLRTALDEGGVVVGINAEGCGSYSRKQIDELTDHAKRYGARGLVWLKVTAEDLEGGSAKFLGDAEKTALRERLGAKEGDLLLLVAGAPDRSRTAMGAIRLEVARRENRIPRGEDAPLFIIDFPMFEPGEEPGSIVPVHHPFTSWKPEDEHLIDTEPLRVRANCYDLVINGYEIGSGSIRIHEQEKQARIFQLLGLSDEEARTKFGFLLEAFRYGAPPHGGYGLGLDRIVMILAGTENIRDVVAFPKTTSAASLMDETPSPVAEDQLRYLGLRIDNVEAQPRT